MTKTGRLTTHVLDTANGRPAGGLKIELFALDQARRTSLKSVVTNDDGRCDEPLLTGEALVEGSYELVFQVGDYFRSLGQGSESNPFLDIVPVRFGVSDKNAHYHVPLLVAPFAYSTYRGS